MSKYNGFAVTSNFNLFNGANLGLAPRTRNSEQKFIIEKLTNGNYKITQFNTNRSLKPLYNNKNNNGAVVQWFNEDSDFQEWTILVNNDGSYTFQNVATAKYIDISVSHTLIQTIRNIYPSQKFELNRLAEMPEKNTKIPGINGKIICIDPGHGTIDSYYNNNFDPGAVQNGLYESTSNMWLASELAQKLRSYGAKVYLTREGEYSPSHAPKISLMDRARLGNNINADMFISIHGNSGVINARGIETYYYKPSSGDSYRFNSDSRNVKSAYLAKCIQEEMINYSGSYNRGVKRANFLVLRETKVPAVLLEVGFLSNPTEAALLKDPEFRTKLVNGMIEGIYRYYIIYY